MSERPPDDLFAQHVRKAGMVTEEQIQAALRELASLAARGEQVPLAEVLVRQGLLTPAMRENLERKLETQREEARRLGPYSQTHPVGQKKPNPWGLFDMHGNVWEWCQDWWGAYGGDVRDPEGPSSGQARCLRGGGWDGNPIHCRSAIRNVDPPTYRSRYNGFRVVLR